jgi:hypothetical protein
MDRSMQNRRTFGRRVSQAPSEPQPAIQAPLTPPADPAPATVDSAPVLAPVSERGPAAASSYESLKTRDAPAQDRRRFPFPWRPLSLIAGLSFGIASFALPDWINDVAQWPLGLLMLGSFYVGLRKPKHASVKSPGLSSAGLATLEP